MGSQGVKLKTEYDNLFNDVKKKNQQIIFRKNSNGPE